MQMLIVEDVETSERLLAKMLQAESFHVTCVREGLAALKMMQDTPFDLVFLDVQLPDINGLLVASRQRTWEREGGHPPTYLIACTAFALSGDRDKCLDAGMDDYMSKPISLNELHKSIERFFREYPSELSLAN